MIEISDFNDATAALTSAQLVTVRDKYPNVHFVVGTIVALNGKPHLARRRAETRLFSPPALEGYEANVLDPLLREVLPNQGSAGRTESVVRDDLVELASYITLRLGAAIVGIDGAETRASAKELLHLVDLWSEGTGFIWSKVADADRERYFDNLVKESRRFRIGWFDPSLTRRIELVAGHKVGKIADAELPNDLLTALLLSNETEHDHDLIFREAGLYLHASIHTTTRAICYVVDEIAGWLEKHPEDSQLTENTGELQNAVWEVLRLHPLVPALVRTAQADVVLPSGRVIPKGADVVILYGEANRDPTIFGPDADQFKPRRQFGNSGVWRYGLSFGAGRHICMGRRMAAGDEMLVGTLTRIISHLFGAGIRRDSQRPVIPVTETFYGGYSAYPVTLGRGVITESRLR
jgi:cytochrome P450